jgi:hypothetical protein
MRGGFQKKTGLQYGRLCIPVFPTWSLKFKTLVGDVGSPGVLCIPNKVPSVPKSSRPLGRDVGSRGVQCIPKTLSATAKMK